MSFDFNHTCPIIDRNIRYIESDVEDFFENELGFNESKTKEYTEEIMERILPYIEEVRQTNEDMRTAAENQIDELLEEIEELNERINELEDEITELEG